MNKRLPFVTLALGLSLLAISCVTQTPTNTNSIVVSSPTPATAASPAPGVVADAVSVPVTLPVLDALLADESFKGELKSKLKITEDQIAALRKAAADEIARLQQTSSETQEGAAAEARDRATEAIQNVVGAQQTEALLSLARERWLKGSETEEAGKPAETTMLPGPNAVPEDTRVVVNIPAYRMDLFHEGSLIKSYRIGIGYPQFPLPTGLRKAQTIIFNPTWTPPDEPWVAKMKDIAVGEKVPAGSPLNPLGPIKIPIGMPSLIHGGKPLAKIGTFASHGCVGLTNAQVRDFAKTLVGAAGKGVSDREIASYLKDPTKTRVVKLDASVPVELRYETVVVEDGKLYIFKDVYDQNTNTEENLRVALEKSGVRFEDFSNEERDQVLEALNAMSSRPKKLPPRAASLNPSPTPTANANVGNENLNATNAKNQRSKVARKPISRKQKQVVLEIAALSGKGYPAPVDLDSGSGKPARKQPTAATQ